MVTILQAALFVGGFLVVLVVLPWTLAVAIVLGANKLFGNEPDVW